MSKGNCSKSQSQTAGAAQKATEGTYKPREFSINCFSWFHSSRVYSYVPCGFSSLHVCCCLENGKGVRKQKKQWHHLHIFFYFDCCLFLLFFFINLPFSFLSPFLLILWCFGLLLVSVFSLSFLGLGFYCERVFFLLFMVRYWRLSST